MILRTNRLWAAAVAEAELPSGSGQSGGDFYTFCTAGAPIVGDFAADVAALMSRALAADVQDLSVKGRVPGPDGSRWLIARVHPVPDRRTAGAVLSVIDITEGMATQERLRLVTQQSQALSAALADEKALLDSVISAIPHLVYWKDVSGRYLGCNHAFRQFRGLPQDLDVIGRSESDLSVQDRLAGRLPRLEDEVLLAGTAVIDHKEIVSDHHGRNRVLLVSVLPQRPSPATPERVVPTGTVGVAADVTLISELEHQLAQANRLESIGQLAAGIAHEINTPIQYVADNTRFVADAVTQLVAAAAGHKTTDTDLDFLAEEIPQALSDSLEGLSQVAGIVRAMKDFSHPGQSLDDADLNAAVETTVQISRSEWKQDAVVQLDLDQQVGLVRCYPGELKQALLNLIVNAAQAIADDRRRRTRPPGTISIRTRRQDGSVQIVVSDDGPGVAATIQEKIFDPFFTTKDVGKGTGQGLALVHAAVQRHGGTVHLESRPGHGATFTITLPDQSPTTSQPPDE